MNKKKLKKVIQTGIRFLDNVIDVNYYPIPEIDRETKKFRKVGLGVMGFADMLIKLGISYASSKAVIEAESLMKFFNKEAELASIELGKERGAFPGIAETNYLPNTQKNVTAPIRNVTRTVIAPTGSISIIADCSSGIEPIFAVAYENIMVDPKDGSYHKLPTIHPLFEEVAKREGFYSDELIDEIIRTGTIQTIDSIPTKIKKLFQTAHDVKPSQHLAIQAAFQKYLDDAASKTINLPNSATQQDIKTIFEDAYKLGCKGVTIYRDGSRDVQALTKISKSTDEIIVEEAAEVDMDIDRPLILEGETVAVSTGCGKLYVTVNNHPFVSEPYELFATIGKAGGCAASQCEALGRLTSLSLQNGVPSEDVIKQLVGITCAKPIGFGANKIHSCADAIGKALQTRLYRITNQVDETKTKVEKSNGSPLLPPTLAPVLSQQVGMGACTVCGGPLEKESGCEVCHSCGASACG